MLTMYLGTLLAGVFCAAAGGELFVRGTVGIAMASRVSPALVATTVAAFATSSPELSVAVNAGIAGEPDIALGDALGANVVTIALTLGLTVFIAPIFARREDTWRDLGVAMLVPVATWIACLDGLLSRVDAVLFLAGFFAWLLAVGRHARSLRRQATDATPAASFAKIAFMLALGLALLLLAGRLVVDGATGLARIFGLSEFVVGATLVAIGTSMPELATSIVAVARGRGEIGLGTILGSNIFNGFFIVPVAALLTPIDIKGDPLALTCATALLAVIVVIPGRTGRIGRPRGLALLAIYAAYVLWMLR